MPGHRRLRKLAPDRELHERLAAGESFRSIGRAYVVAHATVADYSRRPEVAELVRELRQDQQAERQREQDQRDDEGEHTLGAAPFVPIGDPVTHVQPPSAARL